LISFSTFTGGGYAFDLREAILAPVSEKVPLFARLSTGAPQPLYYQELYGAPAPLVVARESTRAIYAPFLQLAYFLAFLIVLAWRYRNRGVVQPPKIGGSD
jgi:hypothetical protein